MSTVFTAPITSRSYIGEPDLAAIAELVNACEAVDCLDAGTSVPELRERMTQPTFDPFEHQRLWQTTTGQIIGWGSLWVPLNDSDREGHWGFKVRPSYRQQGLEAEMLAWAEDRLRQMGQQRGAIMQLRASSRDCQTDRLRFLTEHGFMVDREFYQMSRLLSQPMPPAQLPDGFTVRPVQGEAEAHAWVEMFNQAFIDHWNHHPYTVEQFLHALTSQDYRPDLDLVAIAPDGTLAAFCSNCICQADNQRSGRQEGWVGVLGTRRGFRRLGLGRAMLLTALQKLRAAGMDIALLGVDRQNPSGALHLYQSVGFQRRYSTLSLVKPID